MSNRSGTYHNISAALPTGIVFNILLFFMFCMPAPQLTSFSVGSIITNLREVGLLFLPGVYFLSGNRKINIIPTTLKKIIIAFVCFVIITEIIKIGLFGSSLSDIFKEMRIVLPLISGLLVFLQGVRLRPKAVIFTLFISLLVSFVFTLVFVFLQIDIGAIGVDANDSDVSLATNGRFVNQNFEFALIAIALLFNFKYIDTKFNKIYSFILALCVLVAFLVFNRTVATGILLLMFFFLLKNFSIRILFKGLLITGFISGIVIYVYNTNPAVNHQVNKRILSIVESNDKLSSLKENVYEDNRDVLYQGYIKRLKEYFLFGTPYDVPLAQTTYQTWTTTDISLLTILLRFGIISFVFYLAFLIFLIKYFNKRKSRNKIMMALFPVLIISLLVSFNIDIYVRHNFIFYFLMIVMFLPLTERDHSVARSDKGSKINIIPAKDIF